MTRGDRKRREPLTYLFIRLMRREVHRGNTMKKKYDDSVGSADLLCAMMFISFLAVLNYVVQLYFYQPPWP